MWARPFTRLGRQIWLTEVLESKPLELRGADLPEGAHPWAAASGSIRQRRTGITVRTAGKDRDKPSAPGWAGESRPFRVIDSLDVGSWTSYSRLDCAPIPEKTCKYLGESDL